jgi:lipid-A-disaccharide synthase
MAAPALPFRLPPPVDGRVDLFVVAGEHSGDEHAARVVRGLRARAPGLFVCALGGPKLAAAGAQLLHDMTTTSAIGYFEAIRNYRSFFRPLFLETVRWLREHQPRAVCFVDYGGFNLALADALRTAGLSRKGGGRIQTLYYISPQIWASRAGRRFKLARSIESLAVIFPFETKAYADTGLEVRFVGHPFAAPDYRPPVRYDAAGPVLLLPGSRKQAVARLFPRLLGGYQTGTFRPAIALYPSEEIAAILRACIARAPGGVVSLAPADVPDGSGPVAASAVLTSSGTMSMHCALAGIPGAIAYRADPITYLLGRWLVKIPYLGIANILLGAAMYPEYIQGAATPQALALEVKACLQDGARRAKTEELAVRLRSLLSQPADGTAVDWLLGRLG